MKFATITTTTLSTIILASVTTVVASTTAASSDYVPPTPNPYATCCKNNNGTYIIFSESDGEYGFCKTYSDVWYKAASFTQEQFFYDENCKNEKAKTMKTNQLA